MGRREYNKNQILRDCMAINSGLDVPAVCYICEKTENTVYKWLNNNLTIDSFSLRLIHLALFKAKASIPRELYRCLDSQEAKARNWGKKNIRTNSAVERVGCTLRPSGGRFFIFKGKELSMTQIAKAASVSLSFVSSKINSLEIQDGSDVTSIIKRKRRNN